ncbi:hypothetical protein D915_003156 [Fasciola hepatica]|uniref:Uncharacterized protein n=1 Tax=Fasciola hepatica TaxID=6192 RepID=A0A4E0REF6_FASHE|nr:hypothetical protein D915_003156 [Fasciola hepatica]
MLGLTNPIFAMRVAAFFNKEREIHFERSALSLATVGDGVTGELPNNASDSYACPDLNATINCRQFSTQEVSEFLFSLVSL